MQNALCQDANETKCYFVSDKGVRHVIRNEKSGEFQKYVLDEKEMIALIGI